MVGNKLRFDIKIGCYSNGVAVIIKDKKQKNKVIGDMVFMGKWYLKEEKKWIDDIIKKVEVQKICYKCGKTEKECPDFYKTKDTNKDICGDCFGMNE